jgi:hypothetical protein
MLKLHETLISTDFGLIRNPISMPVSGLLAPMQLEKGISLCVALLSVSGSCTPMIDAINSCDIYAGTVHVYGEGHYALTVIRDHLDFEGTENVHPNVERIFSVTLSDKGEINDNAESVFKPANDYGTSSPFIVGISVAVVTLSIGLVLLEGKRRTRQSQLSEERNASSTASAGDDELAPYEDHASSQDLEEACEVVEEIYLQSGSSLVLHDGQPVYANYVSKLV